jgi:hypothetical protein
LILPGTAREEFDGYVAFLFYLQFSGLTCIVYGKASLLNEHGIGYSELRRHRCINGEIHRRCFGFSAWVCSVPSWGHLTRAGGVLLLLLLLFSGYLAYATYYRNRKHEYGFSLLVWGGL